MITAKRGVAFVPEEEDKLQRRHQMVKGIDVFLTPGLAASLLTLCELEVNDPRGRGLSRDANEIADALSAVVFDGKGESDD